MDLQTVIMLKNLDYKRLTDARDRYILNREEADFASKVVGDSIFNAAKSMYGSHFAYCVTVFLLFEGMSAKIPGDSGGYTFMGLASNYNREMASKIMSRSLTLKDILKHYYERYYLGFNRQHITSEGSARSMGYTPLLSVVPVNIAIGLFNDAGNPSYIGRAIRLYYQKCVRPLVDRGALPKPLDGSVADQGSYFLSPSNPSTLKSILSTYKTRFPLHYRFISDWLPYGFSKFANMNLGRLSIDCTNYLAGKVFREGIKNRAVAILWCMDMTNFAKIASTIQRLKISDLAKFRDDLIKLAKRDVKDSTSYRLPNLTLPSRPSTTSIAEANNTYVTKQKTTVLPVLWNIEDKNLLGVPMTHVYNDINKYVDFKGTKTPSDEPGIRGLLPMVASRLSKLAKNYHSRTGKKLVVNTGWRSWQEQQRLYANPKYKAAVPSPIAAHQIGIAIDISLKSNVASVLLDEANKAGLHRSMPNDPAEQHHFTIAGVYDQSLANTPKGQQHKLAYLNMDANGRLRQGWEKLPVFKLM